MKKIIVAIIFLLISYTSSIAEVYEVYVKRIEQNLYKDLNSGVFIKTKYCYEYTYGERAILIYDEYSYDNKLIFNNDQVCDVDKLLK